MNKAASHLKPLMPILSAVYGVAIIYVTALPLAGDNPTFVDELLTWVITLAAIALTLFLVHRVEPKLFPAAGQFPLKLPKAIIFAGLLLIAPLCLVAEEYIVYGITSLAYTIQMKPLTYTTAELREDLLSSVHAVLLAPLLEELCFRQMAIPPFRRRGTQIVVCLVMAILFGLLHVRNFPGAFISALFYGLIFIWSRNIWYSVALHAGINLTATLLAVYCWLQLGDMQMTKIPLIILPDSKVFIASMFLAIAGVFILKRERYHQAKVMTTRQITPSNADEQIRQLYESAFPEEEQIPWDDLMHLIGEMHLDFTAYYEGSDFIGFTIIYPRPSYNWYWYFAVRDELRNKGYGQEILSLVKERYKGQTSVFDMESPRQECANIEQRKRRHQFYLRNGFRDTNVYRRFDEVEMTIMMMGERTFTIDDWHAITNELKQFWNWEDK